MKVSIVIVNYNGKYLLAKILDSIKKSSFRDYEIIVVDNASSDGSQEFIKDSCKSAKLVENKKNLGYSGINSALKHCRGEYILFLNNDMELDKDCIGNLLKAIKKDKNIAMAAPRLINYFDKSQHSGGTWVSRAFYCGHIKGGKNDNAKEIPYLGVGMIRKDFVQKFGYLFDPDYFIYAEDLDLGLRIRLCNEKIIFEPEAVMHHMHAITTQKTSKFFTTFLMERNLLTTLFKILSGKNVIMYLPYALLARFLAVIKDLITFNFNLAFARLKAIFFVLLNLNFMLRKRKQAQKFRKAGDDYILKIFTENYLFRPKFIV